MKIKRKRLWKQQEALKVICLHYDMHLTAYAPLGSVVDENTTLHLLKRNYKKHCQ